MEMIRNRIDALLKIKDTVIVAIANSLDGVITIH